MCQCCQEELVKMHSVLPSLSYCQIYYTNAQDHNKTSDLSFQSTHLHLQHQQTQYKITKSQVCKAVNLQGYTTSIWLSQHLLAAHHKSIFISLCLPTSYPHVITDKIGRYETRSRICNHKHSPRQCQATWRLLHEVECAALKYRRLFAESNRCFECSSGILAGISWRSWTSGTGLGRTLSTHIRHRSIHTLTSPFHSGTRKQYLQLPNNDGLINSAIFANLSITILQFITQKVTKQLNEQWKHHKHNR